MPRKMDGEACPAGGWGTRSFGIILGSAPQCNWQFRPRFRRRSCDSIVFCKSVSADRTVIAASRLLGAAAACEILLSLQLDLVNRIGVAASRLQ